MNSQTRTELMETCGDLMEIFQTDDYQKSKIITFEECQTLIHLLEKLKRTDPLDGSEIEINLGDYVDANCNFVTVEYEYMIEQLIQYLLDIQLP